MWKVMVVPSVLALALGGQARGEKRIEVNAPGAQVAVQRESSSDKPARSPREARFQLVPASALMGEQVENAAGQALGSLQELAIDTSQRRVVYAVLDFAGAAARADKLYAVPWPALSRSNDGQRLVLNVEQDKLDKADGFPRGQWPEWTDKTWAREIHEFYGQQAHWRARLQGEPVWTERRSRGGRTTRVMVEQPRSIILRSNEEMLGHSVRHASNGETLGELHDLLIDRNSGDLAFVVLKLDRKASVMRSDREKNFVALPAAMFSWDRHGDPNYPYTVECCLKKLGERRFSADNWPDLASKRWAQDIYDSFGRQPYWERD